MPYVYILECSDGTFYTGSTVDLKKRLWEHSNGFGANYTKRRLPIALVYCEEFKRIDEAYRRKRQLHNWSHGKKKALLEKSYEDLINRSECRNDSHHRNAPSTPLGEQTK